MYFWSRIVNLCFGAWHFGNVVNRARDRNHTNCRATCSQSIHADNVKRIETSRSCGRDTNSSMGSPRGHIFWTCFYCFSLCIAMKTSLHAKVSTRRPWKWIVSWLPQAFWLLYCLQLIVWRMALTLETLGWSNDVLRSAGLQLSTITPQVASKMGHTRLEQSNKASAI